MGHKHSPWKRLGDGSLLTQDADEGLGHILPLGAYVKTLSTLIVLTIVTVWVSWYNFGAMNIVIAMVVASIKALLVALFFMHLKFEGRLIVLYAIYPLVLLAILVGGTVYDVVDRWDVQPAIPIGSTAPATPNPAHH